MLVVHLTDKKLDVAIGKKNLSTEITSFASLSQLRGSVRDGIIVDPVGFREAVEPFWKENNFPTDDVKIVLDTTRFMRRTIETPVFKKKTEMEEYLRREILSLGRISNPLFTYEVTGAVSAENTQKVDLMIVESQIVERIVETFGRFGVKVSAVINNVSNVNQAFVSMAQNSKMSGTVLLITATESNAFSILIQDGTYRYGSTQQIFNEYGSESFANEIARNVANVQQFMMAQNISTDLDHVYLVGLNDEASNACINAIADTNGSIDVKALSLTVFGKTASGIQVDNMDNATGPIFPLLMGLCVPDAGRRLVRTLTGEDEQKHIFSSIPSDVRPIFQALIPAGIALVIGIITFIGVSIWNGTVQSQIDTAKATLATPEAKAQQIAYDTAKTDVDTSANEVSAAKTLINNIAQFPKPTSEVNQVVEECADGLVTVEPVSYDSSTGTYTLSAKSDDYSTIYQFVNKVIATGKYTVQYDGYAYNEATIKGGVSGVGIGTVQLDDGNWQLTIQLVLPADSSER